ncbi:MAG: exosome complex RNA-binding protein Csl4 [Candidatus Methanomethylicia archaeon]
MSDGRFVYPGDFIGVIEEFMAGDGVKDIDGSLFAVKFGRLTLDMRERRVSVISRRSLLLPTAGDIGRGFVFDVGFESAGIRVFHIEGKGFLRHPVTAYLRFPNVSGEVRYASMYDVVREGDIVRAVFLNSWIPYNVSVKGNDFGVLFARCPYCLSPLTLRNNVLYCSKCRFHSSRKVASGYFLKI